MVFAACFSAAAADRPPAREQILFSAPRESVDLSTGHPKDEPDSKSFEFLDRNNSISGVIAPFQAPPAGAPASSLRNTRLMLEAYDRKKNWIYGRADDLDQLATAEGAFGRADWGDAGRKPKTALENYFEDRGERRSRIRARDTAGDWPKLDPKMEFGPALDRDSHLESQAHSRVSGSVDPTRTITAGFSLPGDFSPPPGRDPLSNYQSLGGVEPLGNPNSGRNAVGKLLAIPGSINPLVPGFNPLSLGMGAPAQEPNPLPPPRLGEFPAAGSDALNPLRFAPPGASQSTTLLTDPTARPLAPSSLSPAVAGPGESIYVQPKPTVLEIPHRKF